MKVKTTSSITAIKKSTWSMLGISCAGYAVTGIFFAVGKVPWFLWWLLLEPIAMISLAPVVADLLNGIKKQDKLKGFWANFLVWLLITVINATAVTLSLYFVVLSLGYSISSRGVVIIWAWTGFGAWAGSWFWSWSWSWSGVGALALALAWSFAGAGDWALTLALALAWVLAGAWALAGALASEELLELVGKLKAMVMLLGTGLVGMGVGLLVKFLFGL